MEIIRIIGGDKNEHKTEDKNSAGIDDKSEVKSIQRVTTTSRGQVVLFPGNSIPDEYIPSSNDNPFGALDYLLTVYTDNDYYESDFCGSPDIPIEKSIYSGPLIELDFKNFKPPVRGHVTSDFGYREKFGRYHKGIDINLCIGDTIYAALPGKVERIGFECDGYGHFIIVTHANGYETRYAHLKYPIISIGDTVTTSQPIGIGGNSGNSTGPHLHFEIRYMGRAINPRHLYNFQ